MWRMLFFIFKPCHVKIDAMKYFYLGCFLFFCLLGCKPAEFVGGDSENKVAENNKLKAPDGLKAKMPKKVDFATSETVGAIMGYLTSDKLQGRDTGSAGIAMAADYITQYFKAHGVAPYYSSYKDTLSNYKEAAYNVIGVVEGKDPMLKKECIVIGAHYDHIGIVEGEQGDNIANGANDNASGSTAVMEMARYFGAKKNNKRTLIFALFSAEEKGLLGSRHLAKKMKTEKLNLYAMLNFEMLGVPLQSKKYEVYITGYHKSNLAAVSNKHSASSLVGYLPTAKNYGLFQRSDNYDFYREFAVPAHTYCTFDFTNYNFYHKVKDEYSEIDIDHMSDLINKFIPMVKGIANAPNQELQMN